MTTKAIIFDVDGTLADTEDGHRQSFNKAFADNGLNWHWDDALYNKLLKVTGGKERIKYFVSDFLKDFDPPADFEGFVKNLHAIKTAHYTTMLGEGHIPLRPRYQTTDQRCAQRRHHLSHRHHHDTGKRLCITGSYAGSRLAEPVRRQRLRRHRAAQKARTRYLFLGFG